MFYAPQETQTLRGISLLIRAIKNAPVRREGRNRMKKKNCYDVNDDNSAEIPEFVYESLARSLLPVIQKYYESDEGKRAFAEWKEKKEAAAKDST